jgi:hypothetical protein
MRRNFVLGMGGPIVLSFVACNYTPEGECFYRDELGDVEGVGAGPIYPTGGVGGYGSVPLEPQSAPDRPPPICNIISAGPCDDKCQAEYEKASSACARVEDAAQRRACQDKAHAEYRACQEKCEQESSNSCHAKYMWCLADAPFHPCMHFIPGTSDTVCKFCRNECKRGAYPSPDCQKCGF